VSITQEANTMRTSLAAVTVLALAPLVATGCVSKSEYMKTVDAANALEVDNARLKTRLDEAGKRHDQLTADRAELERLLTARSGELGKTITELRQRVSALEGDNARLGQENARLGDDNARLGRELADALKSREEKVKELSSTYDQLVQKMKGEIDKGQVTISELRGKLTVNMVDAILFDSGKAEIKPEGLVVLGKVIEILKSVNDKAIRIEGHTDSNPITGTLAQRYPTNWELSSARAITVARYLQKQAIDPTLLSAAGFGEFKPVADNASAEGRAKNRRIEIVLVPKD
jgi:chemotaxis protein MotB